MIEFDYCINFLESFIICFFSYRYFSLNTKQLIVSNVIIFLEITLGNLFLSSSFLPVFFVLITMIFKDKKFWIKNQYRINYCKCINHAHRYDK